MSLIESKTMCFGLLRTVNDIGDARETLPSPLWLLGQTMIRSGQTDSKMYDVWTFRCTHEGKHERVNTYEKEAYLAALLAAIAREEDPVYIAALEKTRLYKMEGGKLTWDREYLKILANHIPGGKQTRVNKGMWLLSKTGEVNLTKFKQDKKAAIAKFLAKSVEECGEFCLSIMQQWGLSNMLSV